MVGALLFACSAFLLGSFPSGVVLGRLATGRDIRSFGSGNIGAANVARAVGFKLGATVAVLDMLKGLIPVLVAQHLGFGADTLALVAVAAVLGHDFSVFLAFRGGKGVATTLGVALALAPPATILAMLTWLGVLALSGYSSLSSLVALAVLPIYMGITGRPSVMVIAAFALFVLAAGKHWENIIRLIAGKEPDLRRRRASDGR